MRPSSAGPKRVNSEITSSARLLVRVPPTWTVFFALPGAESELSGVGPTAPRFPVLKTTSMSGCDQTKASTSRADCG